MAGPERDGPPIPIAGIVAVLLVAGAVLVQLAPLSTTRPSTTPKVKSRVANVQDVDTRLWQDPLAAVDQHQEQIEKAGGTTTSGPATSGTGQHHSLRHGVADLACQVASRGGVTVLGVMIFGGPYVEDAEHRRRTRYAVVSGLGASGFLPMDPEHIGYFLPASVESSASTRGGPRRQLPATIPYEWFAGEAGDLLLLWLDESAFVAQPLSTLDDLMSQLVSTCASKRPKPVIKVIGPASSFTLREMIEEASLCTPTRRAPGDKPACWRHLVDSHVFTATATASDEWLLGSRNKGIEAFRSQGITFARPIGRDADLMAPLMRELQLRGIDFTRPAEDHHVVLVSEWDTFYAQRLEQTFIEAACAASQQCDRGQRPRWIHKFTYLRGLDGILPQSSKTEDAGTTAKRDEGEKRKEVDAIERTDGDSQVDYLRRLATSIKARDDEVRRQHGVFGRRGIRAVGVLGNDFYDKVLLLKALRRELRDAIFFTTDLDARLLDPRDFRWVRNLIVVSSFGLELHRNFQRGIPPFRDSYQTSTFLATQLALGRQPASAQIEPCVQRTPRTFEVGRRVAFDLSCAAWDKERGCLRDHPQPCPAIHPVPPAFFASPGDPALLLGAIAVLLALLLGYTASEHIRAAARQIASCFRRDRPVVFCATVLGMLAAALVLGGVVWMIVASGPDGEPFSLMAGISIWPTEIIRLVAFVCAVMFLIKGWRDTQRNAQALEKRFLRPDGDAPTPVSVSVLTRLKTAYRPILGVHAESEAVSAQTVWDEYRRDGALPSRAVRVLSIAAIYLIAGGCVILAAGLPHVPYRGEVARGVDRAVLAISVILLIVLIVAVTDAVRLSVRVVRQLSKQAETEWPRRTLQAFREQLGWPEPSGSEPPSRLGLDRWIDIQFIAGLTTATGQLIYYPFIVLFLMIVSRVAWFDDWDLPLGLIVVFAVSLLYSIACAGLLRSWAETSRREAIAYLTPIFIRLKAAGATGPQAEQIKIMIDQIATIKDGAFAPITQQPAVRVLLASFSGVGGLGILQYFAFGGS